MIEIKLDKRQRRAACPAGWELEQQYELRLAVSATRITGWVSEKEIISIADDSEPLSDGGFGFVCEEGLITSDEITVEGPRSAELSRPSALR